MSTGITLQITVADLPTTINTLDVYTRHVRLDGLAYHTASPHRST